MRNRNTAAQAPNQDIAREAAILQNLHTVSNLARRLRRRVPPSVTLDDLISAGTIGLINAVDRFDGTRGLKLDTYARHRILGAMLDFLREEDPLSRDERRRLRQSDESPAPITISLNRLPRSVDARLLREGESTAMWIKADIGAAIRNLSERERLVIALIYQAGLRNREIAIRLNVNESRVSQIKSCALAKLRVAMAAGASRRPA